MKHDFHPKTGRGQRLDQAEETFDHSADLAAIARVLADKFSVNRALGIDTDNRTEAGAAASHRGTGEINLNTFNHE